MTKMSLSLTNDFPQPTEAQWRGLVDKLLKGGDFEKRLVARTEDGIAIQPLYVRSGQAGQDASIAAGTARRGLGWDICQIHAEPNPAIANAAILDDLADGATSIQLQIAAPGWSGLPYDGASLGRALDGVLLEVCPIALVAGEYTPDAAGSLMALWQQRGLADDGRLGAFNYDPLGTLAQTGALYHPVERALGIAAGLVGDTRSMPGVTALAANGSIWHWGGATDAQELAYVLSSLVAYLRACETAGVAPADSLPKMAVTLAADADQLMGLAKFRAIRVLMARMAEACGAGSAAARVPVTAETSRRMMTRRDPWVNLLRTTMACATAAMGGADRIVVLPFSWAIGKPDAFARRIARNTHHVLIEEAGLGRVFDPAAGSFAIEALTRDLAAKAWTIFQEIEAKGGMAAALQSGFVQQQLAAAQTARMQRLAQGQIEQTGTSAFPSLGSDGVTVAPWPEDARSAELNGARVTPLVMQRLSEPFEQFRDWADDVRVRTGKAPTVFLAQLGDPAEFAARATWVRNFLAAGGIETMVPAGAAGGGFLSSVPLGAAFGESGLSVAVLCGTDVAYDTLGEAAASVLKQAGARMVLLAGRPKAQEASLKAAGVDVMMFAGGDRIATLKALQTAVGASA
jgi:methylmalonyl-CoA mutase